MAPTPHGSTFVFQQVSGRELVRIKLRRKRHTLHELSYTLH